MQCDGRHPQLVDLLDLHERRQILHGPRKTLRNINVASDRVFLVFEGLSWPCSEAV